MKISQQAIAAKEIRQMLVREFPHTKFCVNSGSGNCAYVFIQWEGEPRESFIYSLAASVLARHDIYKATRLTTFNI
jgi:hypothetical protein